MKLAAVIEAPEESARGMLQALDASPYLAVQRALSTHDGEAAMMRAVCAGCWWCATIFPSGWPPATMAGPAQLVVNATDPNTARILEGYVSGALQVWLAGQPRERRLCPMGASICNIATGSIPNCVRPISSCLASSPW